MEIFKPADIRRHILEYCADFQKDYAILQFLDIFVVNTIFNQHKYRLIHSIINRYLNLNNCLINFGIGKKESNLLQYQTFHKQFCIYRKLGYSIKNAMDEALLFNLSINNLEFHNKITSYLKNEIKNLEKYNIKYEKNKNIIFGNIITAEQKYLEIFDKYIEIHNLSSELASLLSRLGQSIVYQMAYKFSNKQTIKMHILVDIMLYKALVAENKVKSFVRLRFVSNKMEE
tara:strand:+ start:85 stop:774 length:690 start_codon:yes stop_codon:yes gene_type:complete